MAAARLQLVFVNETASNWDTKNDHLRAKRNYMLLCLFGACFEHKQEFFFHITAFLLEHYTVLSKIQPYNAMFGHNFVLCFTR